MEIIKKIDFMNSNRNDDDKKELSRILTFSFTCSRFDGKKRCKSGERKKKKERKSADKKPID